MLKRAGVIAAIAAAMSVVVATTAWGSGKAPARASAAAAAKVKCGNTVSIGVAYPATGDAASIGVLQWHWAKYAMSKWNKSHKLKIRLVPGDTQLPNTAQALSVAHQFAGNAKILAVTGPAGSQEVQDTIAVYKKAGLAAVSGSATRVALTRAKKGAPRETTKGYFFRTVPTDGQQGDRDAGYIHSNLHASRVYIIDDQEAYSQGLADQVQADLKKISGTTVTRNSVSQSVSDFSSLITAIPQNTQVVFIPWQLADKAQLFFQQLRAAGKSAIVFGSDGTDAPGTFEPKGGGYVSGFPVDFASKTLKAYEKAHKGSGETFGLPTYTSVWINATAIQMACKAGKGTTTRAAVRSDLLKVKLSKKQSLLGFPVKFLKGNKGSYQGAGDMGGSANFAVYKVASNGNYIRVG